MEVVSNLKAGNFRDLTKSLNICNMMGSVSSGSSFPPGFGPDMDHGCSLSSNPKNPSVLKQNLKEKGVNDSTHNNGDSLVGMEKQDVVLA